MLGKIGIKRFSTVLVIIFITIILMNVTSVAQGSETRVIVKFRVDKPHANGFIGATEYTQAVFRTQESLLETLDSSKATINRQYEYVPFLALSLPATEIRKLSALPQVISVQEDTLSEPSLLGTVSPIGIELVWNLGYSGKGWTVAVLDTGFDTDHPFLKNKIVEEACFSTTSSFHNASSLCPNGMDEQIGPGTASYCDGIAECEHGSHVAGIIAGKNDTMAGVAKDATLIAVQIYSKFNNDTLCDGHAPCLLSYTSDQLAALEYVYGLKNDYNISAVNMSLGGTATTSVCDYNPLKPIIDDLWQANIATIAAAGNDGFGDAIDAPACISTVVSVGASDYDNNGDEVLGSFSNRSPFLKLLAPGKGIYSAIPNNSYSYRSGTSVSTPQVAGAWAVLQGYSPDSTSADILNALIFTGHPVTDTLIGVTFPRIQVDSAINILPPPPVPPSGLNFKIYLPLLVSQSQQ